MTRGKSGSPVSGWRAAASAWAAALRASSTWRGVTEGRPGVAVGGIQVDHRRRVLVRREGERPLPVERELGGDGVRRTRPIGPRGRHAWRARGPDVVEGLARTRRRSLPEVAGERGDPGVDEDPVDVDPAEAGAEAVVADDHHAGRPGGRPARRACRWRRRALRMTAPAAAFIGGIVDAGLVDVQVPPGAVLERVEVLELDHQGRPVRDHLVGEHAAVGAGEEDLGGGVGDSRSSRRRRAEAASRSTRSGSSGPRRGAVGERPGCPRARLRGGGRPSPRRRGPARRAADTSPARSG